MNQISDLATDCGDTVNMVLNIHRSHKAYQERADTVPSSVA